MPAANPWAIGHHTLGSPYGAHWPWMTLTPGVQSWSAATASSTRRDLPIPASPTTDTMAQCPVATSSVTDCSSERSVMRPTNAISERRRRFAAGAMVPSASHAFSICSRPLSSAGACCSKRIASEQSTRVASPTSTPPSGANSCSREAMLTTSPIAV